MPFHCKAGVRRRRMTAGFVTAGIAASLLLSTGGLRPAQAAGKDTDAAVTKVTSVEGITEYRLANGLRVLLLPDNSKQTTTVNITYLVGSRNENYGEKGMAHLLEHLMFKGATTHQHIAQELTDHGARANGTTWLDRTNYFETFATSDANLDWALDMEADRMVHSFIARKDLDSEMSVVRNEFESGENNPTGVLDQRVVSSAYLWHNYGHDTIGARSDIEDVPIDRLQAFWRNYYQPDNSVLTVAGNFDPDKTLDLIVKKFGAIPKPARVIQATYTVEPTQDGERSVTLRRTGTTGAVAAAYHVPAGSDPDSPALDVLCQILSDAPSGRLYKALVETKKASYASASQYSTKEPGVLVANADVPDPKSLDEVRSIFLKTLDEAASVTPTDAEVNRAKTQLLKDIDNELNSTQRVGTAISEYIALGDWRLIFLNRDRLKAVTAADVQRVAKLYLKPDNRTVGAFIPTAQPDRAEIPKTPDVVAMLKDYKGGETVSAGEAFDPSVANIEKRVIRSEIGGIHAVLLPKKTRGEVVTATITFRIGNLNALKGRTEAARMAGAMLDLGADGMSQQDIQDTFDRLKANVGIGGGGTSIYASIQTTRANLAETMKVVANILRHPTFPEGEFERLKARRIAGIQSSMGEPGTFVSTALGQYAAPYPKDDIRYRQTPEEQIQSISALKLDDVKAFYKDFYGASTGELAVAGDFDPVAVAKEFEDLFGGWKSKTAYERVPYPYIDLPAVNKTFETPDKANATTSAFIAIALRDDDPDYPALQAGSFILGGGFLNSRLATRIRQHEGISYGVGAGMSANSFDRSGSISMYGIYAPQNAVRFETAMREELERFVKDGITETELAAAKQALLQQHTVSRAQDGELAGLLASRSYQGRTLAYDSDQDAKINALTVSDVNAAIRKYVRLDHLAYFKGGDFANAKMAPAKQ